ncbi:MAG: (d)CMP kinase [Gammaproteobacteria bacterium]
MEHAVPVLTLDGPGGVGKGTICLRVARETGWHILDSGSLYRLVGLVAARHGLDLDALPNPEIVTQLAEIAKNLDIDYVDRGDHLGILLAGEDVAELIRTEQVGALASKVAAVPEVRAALLARQRAFARPPGLVADGRDMGSVVFPRAGLKIFLTASAEERAKRRYKQLIEKGIGANLPGLVAELKERDERDTQRSASPLIAAADAHVIDTTHMSIDEVANAVLDKLRQCYDL